MSGVGDFDFLFGRWQVRHRKLRKRLAGSSAWDEFSGTCEAQPLLSGAANYDDNVLDDPLGAYRAMTLRRFDGATGQWSIWWIDARFMRLEPPVHGGFDGDVGLFFGEDEWEGRPIRVRFIWRKRGASGAQWEQSFSADKERAWESNWIMDFTRA
jgi:hypothetical protein